MSYFAHSYKKLLKKKKKLHMYDINFTIISVHK